MNFKNWFFVNKEGIGIGGAIGGIVSYLAIKNGESAAGHMMTYLTLIFHNSPWSIWAVGIVLGALVGMLVDSIIEPNK